MERRGLSRSCKKVKRSGLSLSLLAAILAAQRRGGRNNFAIDERAALFGIRDIYSSTELSRALIPGCDKRVTKIEILDSIFRGTGVFFSFFFVFLSDTLQLNANSTLAEYAIFHVSNKNINISGRARVSSMGKNYFQIFNI